MHQFPVDIDPVFPCPAVHNLHSNLLELLLIATLSFLADQFLSVNVFLQRKQYLVRIDWFDEIVGNLASNSLVHDVLLLTLCHHHYRYRWGYLLDALQGVKPRESWHHLIEQHEVKVVLLTLFNGVLAIGHCDDFIAFLFQKEQMGTEQFHLVVGPQ